MQFPILSIIVFAPLVVAVVMLMMKPTAKNEIRVTALAAAVLDLTFSRLDVLPGLYPPHAGIPVHRKI